MKLKGQTTRLYKTFIEVRYLCFLFSPVKQDPMCLAHIEYIVHLEYVYHIHMNKYHKTSYIRRTLGGNNCRSLKCSWSIACRRCSNYIFVLHLTFGLKGFGKERRKAVRESFKYSDLVRLVLETWRYAQVAGMCWLCMETTIITYGGSCLWWDILSLITDGKDRLCVTY